MRDYIFKGIGQEAASESNTLIDRNLVAEGTVNFLNPDNYEVANNALASDEHDDSTDQSESESVIVMISF